VIKMIMALRRGLLPKTLHVAAPSSNVDWSAGPVKILREPVDWPENGHPRRAGVSSFGISGTNAHLILEQPPVAIDVHEPAGLDSSAVGPAPIVLSGKSRAALRAQAARFAAFVEARPEVSVADLALSSLTTRSVFEHRAVVLAEDAAAAVAGLSALAEDLPAAGLVTGRGAGAGRLAVVFSGQGGQRSGMGQGLYARFPVFAAAWDEVAAGLGLPLDELVAGDLDRTGDAQPALFALQVALFRLVESWGVRPEVLIGHSVGEIAAAHVAGVLSLADACTLVVARARLMQALPAGGAMVAVAISEAAALELVAGREDEVSIAAMNGPSSVVLSGVEDAVVELVDRIADRDVRWRRLSVSHAFHSPLMRPMLDEFAEVLSGLTFCAPELPIVSTVTGEPATLDDPRYWVRQVCAPVRFADAVEAARGQVYLELGPDAVTTAMTAEILAGSGTEPAAVAVLRGDGAEQAAATRAMAELFVRGVPVDLATLLAGTGARRIDLPTYAFQRERFWPSGATLGGARSDAEGVDTAFWQAVESEDLASLAATLRVEDEALSGVLPALSAWHRDQRERSLVDSWRYRVTWKALGAQSPTAAEPRGEWLVLVPERLAEDIWAAEVLAALGPGAVSVPVSGVDRGQLVDTLVEFGDRSWAGVLSLAALDSDEAVNLPGESLATIVGESQDQISGAAPGVALTVSVMQALGDAGVAAPLWCATRGAVSMGRMEPVLSRDQAGVWGLGRVCALEYPQRWGGLVDLPPVLDGRVTSRLRQVLAGWDGEDQVAVRASGVFGRRLVHAPAGPRQNVWQPRGTILITGGTGALGARVARWLAEHGVEGLVLTSRQGPGAPGAAELDAELTALGVRVSVVACDVADRDALETVLAEHSPTGIVHTAGISQGGMMHQLGQDELADVLRAKVLGAANLDALLGEQQLDCFVLFSSIAGVWGSGGQAAYAAANAYLDALAEQRRARGLAATSVAWGAWAQGGMAETAGAEEYLSRRGVGRMAPEPALTALWRAVAQQETTVTVADIKWAQFAPTFMAARRSPLFSDLPEVRDGVGSARDAQRDSVSVALATESAEDLRQRLVGLDIDQRQAVLRELVQRFAAAILGHSEPSAIDIEHDFLEQGFDSLTATELRTAVASATGLELPPTVVFDNKTPVRLADWIVDEIGDRPTAGEAARPQTSDGQRDGTLSELFHGAVRAGKINEGLELLFAAARIRPVYELPDGAACVPHPVTLASGAARPKLICVSTTMVNGGVHQYARIAGHLRGSRDVSALPLAGFELGESLPATGKDALGSVVQGILEASEGQPFVLLGHSAGGMLAYAAASALCGTDAPLCGVAMLDTFYTKAFYTKAGQPEQDAEVPPDDLLPTLFESVFQTESYFGGFHSARLSALAHWYHLWPDIEIGAVDVPVLFVQCTEPIDGMAKDSGDWRSTPVDSAHTLRPLAANHFSMLEDKAGDTVRLVESWLDTVPVVESS
jgi:acyl transferase domain-containing protein/thioesterase domain-containing protein